MPKPAPTTEQFSEILTELTDFKDYFTEDSKINELVETIYEETKVPKAAIRLAIKRIAPFLAGTVGVAIFNKLHANLSKYSWYFTLSQRLLDSLKTMGDKSLDLALDIPSNEHLEALITDKAKWANLKSEHQGLVQLLLGQNELSEGLDSTRQALEETQQNLLDSLVSILAFSLDLKTPDFIIAEAENAKAGSAQWLTYSRRQARLIGRSNSLHQLNDFFDQDASFVWWVISGSGGVGKSRLALDAIEHRQILWEVGFLSNTKLKKDDALSGWQPQSPTIIIIDYAAEYPEAIQYWLDYFIQYQKSFDFPVRLLILEREYQDQNWWDKLVSGSSDALTRKNYLYTAAPHELEPLNQSGQRAALKSFLESLACKSALPDDENSFWGTLHLLSNKGRPLFIGMVAVAIANNGINHLRKWNQEELLNYVLQHEKSAWERQMKDIDEDRKSRIYQLLAFATVTSGLNFEDEKSLFKALRKCELGKNDSEIESNIALANQLSGGNSGYLQPDIFGEYFVLQQWQYKNTAPNGLLKKRLLAAQKLDTPNTYAFLTRTAVDYPKDETPFRWWCLLEQSAKKNKARSALNELSFGIIGQLSQHGNYTEALTHWLPPLSESDEEKTKAKALNLLGLQNDYLGNLSLSLSLYEQSLLIYKLIGDKSGEGTTLNNISQIYDARGDYKTAINYLNQSLVIQQEIGDKIGESITLSNIAHVFNIQGDYETTIKYLNQALIIQQEIGNICGESTTLNNIATTAHSRGDYDTSINYLSQSLKIQRETGNRHGEGTTLNNISQIYYALGDDKTAFNYLSQSLVIQREIGDKFGEGKTLSNISQIFRSRGDFETALNYMKQSLAIRQEIGDKLGEGTTLNNISQIFRSRGDFETTLHYLYQSHAIQLEIGDAAGLCATSFNIGHIHWQNDQKKDAYTIWASAYKIAKKIGSNHELEALESLAEQLGLPQGLKGWETALVDLEKNEDE